MDPQTGLRRIRGRSNVLSHYQRIEIINLFETKNITKAELGRMYGVTEGAIRKTIAKKVSLLEKTDINIK